MSTLRDFYVRGMLKTFPQLQRRLDQAQAYQRVFVTGQASPDECKTVLRDLMQASLFLEVDAALIGDEALFRAGQRAIFAHILQRLRWAEGELLQLGQEATFDQVAAHEAQREMEAAA